MDHYGDDLVNHPGYVETSVTNLAEKCSNEAACNAFLFNYVLSNSYLKSYAGEPSNSLYPESLQGCYYKKNI